MWAQRLFLRSFEWLSIILFCLSQTTWAQTDCGKNGATRTIKSSADATTIASCPVFSGSIALSSGALGIISLDGIQEIIENLVVGDAGALTSLSAPDLRRIDGNFMLSNATLLSTISFASLTVVGGKIDWFALPAISTLSFDSGISQVQNVVISDTFLSTLEGLNLTNADNVDINNNNRLKVIKLALETSKTSITIRSNGLQTQVELPQLRTSGTITLMNISSVSLPSLSFISGGFLLQGTGAENLTADSLSVITKDLYLRDNLELTTLSLKSLVSVGAINMLNNTLLSSVGFEKLSRAENISMNGNFTSITLPGITTVNNTFNIQPSNPNFDCSVFDAYKTQAKISGDYACIGKHQVQSETNTTTPSQQSSSSTSSTIPTGTSSPTSSSTNIEPSRISGGAKGGIAVSSVLGSLALATSIILYLRRRKSKIINSGADDVAPVGVDGKAEMDTHEVSPRNELPANVSSKELSGGDDAHELAGEHGVAEMENNEPEQTFELSSDPFLPRGENHENQSMRMGDLQTT